MYSTKSLNIITASGRRLLCTSSISRGIWGTFSERSSNLALLDETVRKDIFEGIDIAKGPASLSHRSNADKVYYSPEQIDETFKMAYDLLEQESEKVYAKLNTLKEQFKEAKDENRIKFLRDRIDRLSAIAEEHNPEVIFNAQNFPEKLDRSQAVYRKFLKQNWESHDMMELMQRLEQLKVIPDTLPTLDPKVEVKVRFGSNLDSEFSSWIKPGSILPSFAVAKPPTIKIDSFDPIDSEKLFTVLLVNPDEPDLSTNSFKTTLHYGLNNVRLTNNENEINPQKLLSESSIIFKEYVPLLPSKNAGIQRACVWILEQKKEYKINSLDAENFDIRSFVEQNDLNPLGAHVWRQSFDRSVSALREQFGLPKARVFHRVRNAEPLVGHSD